LPVRTLPPLARRGIPYPKRHGGNRAAEVARGGPPRGRKRGGLSAPLQRVWVPGLSAVPPAGCVSPQALLQVTRIRLANRLVGRNATNQIHHPTGQLSPSAAAPRAHARQHSHRAARTALALLH